MPVRKASEMDSSSDCEELCRSSKKAKTSPVKKDRNRSAEKKAKIAKASPSVKKDQNGSAEKKNTKTKKTEKDSMSNITNVNLSPAKDQAGAYFIGPSVKKDEAARRWPDRYNKKKSRVRFLVHFPIRVWEWNIGVLLPICSSDRDRNQRLIPYYCLYLNHFYSRNNGEK